MGETTGIAWCDHTFNPWIGCTKVHAGCTNCYAEAQNKRWAYNGGVWGKDAPRKVTSASNWRTPLAWARQAAKVGVRSRVFCASLADVLDEQAPVEAQARLWELIRETAYFGSDGRGAFVPFTPTRPDARMEIGGLDWLLLTKRPERWELIPYDVRPLVWLGTSISDQATADEWVPRLLKAEGFAVRFLSIEPQVGPVNLWEARYRLTDGSLVSAFNWGKGVDWVIVGGESGVGARPFDIAWARSIIADTKGSAACFVKQLGVKPHGEWGPGDPPTYHLTDITVSPPVESMELARFRNGRWNLRDKKGGDPSEWPADLRVRQFPEVRR